jgi:hypothetical protein
VYVLPLGLSRIHNTPRLVRPRKAFQQFCNNAHRRGHARRQGLI